MLLISLVAVAATGVLFRPDSTRSVAIHPHDMPRAVATATGSAPPDVYRQALQGGDRHKGLFLDNLLLALNTYGKPGAANSEYLEDFDGVYATLARLLHDDSANVADHAALVMNVLALMQRTSDIPPVSESATIRSALDQVIADSAHDTARAHAIDAFVLLYPPDEDMIDALEKILQGDMDRYPESHAAAFRAYGIFKRRYGYQLPDTTLTAAKNLLAHPSQAVRVKAEYALAEMSGASALPTLMAQLEQAGNSSEGRMLTALILRLDSSQDTLDKLNRIAGKTP